VRGDAAARGCRRERSRVLIYRGVALSARSKFQVETEMVARPKVRPRGASYFCRTFGWKHTIISLDRKCDKAPAAATVAHSARATTPALAPRTCEYLSLLRARGCTARPAMDFIAFSTPSNIERIDRAPTLDEHEAALFADAREERREENRRKKRRNAGDDLIEGEEASLEEAGALSTNRDFPELFHRPSQNLQALFGDDSSSVIGDDQSSQSSSFQGLDGSGTQPTPDPDAPVERLRLPFRLQAKNIFCTYSKCPLDKWDVQEQLLAKFENGRLVKWMLIGQEHHKTGDLHLHVLIELLVRPNIRDCHTLDVYGPAVHLPNFTVHREQYHGKYEPLRHELSAIRYICKEDKDPLAYNLDPKREMYLKSSKMDRVAMAAFEGEGDWERRIRVENPGLHMTRIRDIHAVAQQGERDKLGPKKCGWLRIPRKPDRGPHTELEPEYHLIPLGFPRDMRQPQPYIFGPPKTGKTTVREELEARGFRGFEVPDNNDYSGFQNEFFSFMYIDEFNGEATLRVQKVG
jgi:hypothetical protein